MIWLLALLTLSWGLFYFKASIHKGTLIIGLIFASYLLINGLTFVNQLVWIGFLLLFIPLTIPFIRQRLISRRLFKLMKSALPAMSQTEQEALEAGNTWWDAELFSGNPEGLSFFNIKNPVSVSFGGVNSKEAIEAKLKTLIDQ